MNNIDSGDDPAPEDLSQPCAHLTTEIRLRTLSNGSKAIHSQCLRCGHSTAGAIARAKFTAQEIEALAPFDDGLKDRYNAEVTAHQVRENELRFAREGDPAIQRTEAYRKYLLSPEWRAKRARVLQRANHICEGCLSAPAVQVHHLTYKHVFNELLFELVAICEPCHQKCHLDKP